MEDAILINEDAAHRIVKSIPDDITRNLVMFAVGEVRMRAVRRTGQSEEEWRSGLPQQPFDMQFFATVVASMLSQTDVLRAVLDGKSLAQAAGWDC